MQEIKINITKARIQSYSVDMRDEVPVVSATIGLYTEGGKEITSYTISSNDWRKEFKFDLPIDIAFPIRDIAEKLERIVADHCECSTLRLEVLPTDSIPAEIPF